MRRYRVLVVEDDAGNKLVLANIFRVSECIDGVFEEKPAAVLDIVGAGDVDMVLMDVTLHNSTLDGQPIDGLELTRRIKQLPTPAARRTPVVLLTAHCMVGDADRFMKASGADSYIAKPLQDIDGFIVWLSLTMEEYRAQAAA